MNLSTEKSEITHTRSLDSDITHTRSLDSGTIQILKMEASNLIKLWKRAEKRGWRLRPNFLTNSTIPEYHVTPPKKDSRCMWSAIWIKVPVKRGVSGTSEILLFPHWFEREFLKDEKKSQSIFEGLFF